MKSAAILVLAALPALPASAGTFGVVPPADVAVLDVLPGWREGDRHIAALRIVMAPGWHTYWRAPGEAGIPPSFSWSGSRNLAGVGLHWPVPEVIDVGGLRSLGYFGTVVLPITVAASDPSQPVHLAGRIDMGVCDEVCLPFTVEFAAELPPAGAPDPVIRAALADRARSAKEAGVAAVVCTVDPIRDGLKLTARLGLPPQGEREVVVIEPGVDGIWASSAESRREGGHLVASAELVPPEAQPFALDRSKIRITAIGNGKAVEIEGCPAG